MGVVYKAADLKLKRLVALKFLPLSYSRHQEAHLRFIQEAQAASVLDHQNICTIHEVDQSERDQMYIVMAYYDGETLKKKIDRGPLPVDQAVDIMSQVAEGLLKAHSKGIIHRDIKPANVIMTSDGIAKIIDFGLAKLVSEVGRTRTSTVVGTIAYMSPEQALGENIDLRTDLWSLGVLFFELLAGKAPFKGENYQSTIYSIVHKLPLPLAELREDIPEEAEQIIYKCLMKKPEDRYQSADQLHSDLVKLKVRLAEGPAEEREKETGQRKETERRWASVMAATIIENSAMLKLMETEETILSLNRLMALIDAIIKKYGGWIEKTESGSLIALFGIPEAIEDAPKKAINAAIELRNNLRNFNKKEKPRIPLDIHIGIDTGTVMAGTLGVGAKTEYSVLGEAVNTASLLRDISEKEQIYVGLQAYRSTKDEFEYESLKAGVPKGSRSIVPVFRLLSTMERVHRPRLGAERMIYSEMVGRDKELSELEYHLLKAIHGQGSIVNIVGDAGIGKSRLVAEFKRKNIAREVIFLEGRALSIGKNLSFHPIIDVIKNWAGIKDDVNKPENIQKLLSAVQEIDPEGAEERFPFIGALTGMKLAAKYAERLKGIEGEALEKLILKCLKELIIKAAHKRPLVFIIEDLHWADISSVKLLEPLFRLAESQSILFINVFRPNYQATSERLRKTIKNRYADFYVDIMLESLKENEAETLIYNLLKTKSIPTQMKALITERAEGNPFFIEEVVRSFIDDGVVVLKDGTFRVTQNIDYVVIPQTINELLMARIDRLDQETRSLLKVASVVGRTFFYKILRDVARPIEVIDDRLAYLEEIQLLRRQKRLDEVEYFFKHALAQEAVYNSILPKKRKEIHLRVAHTIESIFQERLPEFYGMLAYHFSLGEDLDKAEEYLIRCGEEALKSSASSEAIYYYQEALKIYLAKYGAAADQEKIAMLEKNIAIAFFNKGQYQEAVEYFDKAGAFYKQKLPRHPAATAMKFLLGFMDFLICLYLPVLVKIKNPTSKDKEIIGLYEKKSRALSIINPRRFFIESFYWIKRLIRSNLSEVEGGAGIYAMTSALFCYSGLSMRLSLKILKHIENRVDLNDSKSLLCARFAKLMHCYLAGDWDEIEEFDDHLLNLNLGIGEIFDTSNYLIFHGYLRLEQESLEATQKYEDLLLEISNTFEDDYSKSIKYFLKARSLFKYRKFTECVAESDAGIAILDKLGYGALSMSLYSYKARINMWLGNIAEAVRLLGEAERIQLRYDPVPIYKSQYCLSQFSLAINQMNQSIKSKNIPLYKKSCQTAAKTGKNMMRYAYKVAADIPEAERLRGIFCWLKGQQKKALICWKKSIKEAEARRARLELSRTYLEVGARLLEKSSRYHQLNGLSPEQYLEKAKKLFRDMGLQWNLNEMEKMTFN